MDESANRGAYPAGGMDSRAHEYDHGGMRTLALVVALSVAACSSADDGGPESIGAVVSALDGGDAAALDPECDGSNTRHICGAIQATKDARYGATPKCTGIPHLGGVERAEGRTGCVEVSGLTGNAPATALCCP